MAIAIKETKENIDKEIWKDIKGYEGMYQVSSEGRVKSLERIITDKNGRKLTMHGKIIKTRWLSRNNYLKVDLCRNGHYKEHYVHQLVANAFIPNQDYDFQVRHKNKNKRDNRVENLYRLPWDRPIKYTKYINGAYEVKTFPSVTEAAQQTDESTEWIRRNAGHRYSNWEYVEN